MINLNNERKPHSKLHSIWTEKLREIQDESYKRHLDISHRIRMEFNRLLQKERRLSVNEAKPKGTL